MIDSSSWTAYFQHFGQFFNGFLFTIAIALGSFTLAMLLGHAIRHPIRYIIH